MITKGQRRLLAVAGGLVKKAFPDMAGNVRFNLFPNRMDSNVNVAFSVIIDYDNKIEVEAEVHT